MGAGLCPVGGGGAARSDQGTGGGTWPSDFTDWCQVVREVQEQWLVTDISQPGVTEKGVLPGGLEGQRVVSLEGAYTLMVGRTLYCVTYSTV